MLERKEQTNKLRDQNTETHTDLNYNHLTGGQAGSGEGGAEAENRK